MAATTTAAFGNEEDFNKTGSDNDDVADKSLVYEDDEDAEETAKPSKGRLNNGTSKKAAAAKSEPDDEEDVEDEEDEEAAADEQDEEPEEEEPEDEEVEEEEVEEPEPVKKVAKKRGRKSRQQLAEEAAAAAAAQNKDSVTTTTLKIEPVPSTSSINNASKKEDVKKEANEVDLDQCRVCKAKDELVDLFGLEDNVPISNLIMTVSSVKILDRDYLPKLVCQACVAKMKVAVDFKTTCEATDAEFRSKLKRSKKTGAGRRRGDFILVDCALSSENTDEEAKDDDEFQLSEAASDSDVSFNATSKRKKRGRQRRSSPKKRLSRASPKTKRGGRADDDNEFDQVYVDEAPAVSGDSSDDEPISKQAKTPVKPPARRGRPPKNPEAKAAALDRSTSKIPHKKRAIQPESDEDYEEVSHRGSATKVRKEHPCPFCDEVFSTFERLKEHKKKYIGLKPLTCTICQKAFKQRVSFEAHVRRHQEDETRLCKVCNQAFGSRMELRRHEQSVHDLSFECDKCKRPFTSKVRLDKHMESKCPGIETSSPSVKRKSDADGSAPMGKDLFKCVAPLTTTYWSDSFSD